MKGLSVFAWLIVIAALALSACAPVTAPQQGAPADAGAAASGDAAVEIEFWQHDSGGKIQGMAAVIESFQQMYPNITVKRTSLPYEEYQTKIAASVPAGTGPDVAMSYFGWIPLWAKSGFIAPLPDDLAAELDEQFVPFQQVTKVDGKQYSVLTSVRNFALFYNKGLLAEAGWENPPTTWDEFVQAAIDCTKTDDNGNITQAGYFVGWEEDGWNLWRPVIASFGGEFASEDGRETLFNQSDEAKQAWQFMLDFTLTHKTSSPGFYEGEQAAFAAGLSCLSPELTFSVGFFQENAAPGVDWGVAPMPAGPEGSITTGSSWPLVLTTKAAQDPAKLDASLKFLRFMATQEGQTLYNDITKELPSRNDMLTLAKYTEDPVLKPFIDGLPQTTGVFWVDELAQRQCAIDMYNSVVVGGEDPMTALDNGAACDQALRDAFFER
jgi:multiple sugar transport system substrate-binding protein